MGGPGKSQPIDRPGIQMGGNPMGMMTMPKGVGQMNPQSMMPN